MALWHKLLWHGNRKDADGAYGIERALGSEVPCGLQTGAHGVPWASKQEIVPRDLLNREAGCRFDQ